MESLEKAIDLDSQVALYYLDRGDLSASLGNHAQAIDDLIQQGKVRYAGVSNFSAVQLQECLKVRHVDSDQPRYNLLDREIEDEVLPFCQEQGIGVLAYAPLGQGLLTGSYEEDHVFSADDIRSQNERFTGEQFKRTIRMAKQLAAYAADHGHTLIELDIAWVLAHPAMTTALVGAKSPAQVDGWLGAGDWELTAQQMREIDEIVASMDQVAEGVKSTPVVASLARSLSVDMPITEEVRAVIEDGRTAAEAYRALLDRPPTSETRL